MNSVKWKCTWTLTQPITVMHGTQQTVSDLWPSPLPLCTVHNRQYLTSDPVHYRYARYIPDSDWPLTHSIIVMHGTYRTVSDLWPSPLPLCRYIPESIWPLTQSIIVMHGTQQTVSDLWPSPLSLCTVHNRQYLTSDPVHYRYARYITDSIWPLTQSITVIQLHTRQYLTYDPVHYRYAQYITDSTWPLTQPITVM